MDHVINPNGPGTPCLTLQSAAQERNCRAWVPDWCLPAGDFAKRPGASPRREPAVQSQSRCWRPAPGPPPVPPGLRPVHPGPPPVPPGLRPVHPVLPRVHRGLRPVPPGLRPVHPGPRPVHPGLRPVHPVLPRVHPGPPPRLPGHLHGRGPPLVVQSINQSATAGASVVARPGVPASPCPLGDDLRRRRSRHRDPRSPGATHHLRIRFVRVRCARPSLLVLPTAPSREVCE